MQEEEEEEEKKANEWCWQVINGYISSSSWSSVSLSGTEPQPPDPCETHRPMSLSSASALRCDLLTATDPSFAPTFAPYDTDDKRPRSVIERCLGLHSFRCIYAAIQAESHSAPSATVAHHHHAPGLQECSRLNSLQRLLECSRYRAVMDQNASGRDVGTCIKPPALKCAC